ncbi:MAG: O-antigen polymerase [Bacteroidota bacterium]
MTVLMVAVFTATMIAVGKMTYRTWFNPIGFYSVIWGFVLGMFELKYIHYYSLQVETWVIIISSWLLYVIGAVTISLVYPPVRIVKNLPRKSVNPILDIDVRYLKNIIWVLNLVSLTAALYNLSLMAKLSGGLLNAFIIGNLVYSYRVAEGIPGAIPYVASLVFTAATLSGAYTAKVQKITFVGVLPVITIIIIDFTVMGRADILIVGFLFSAAYFATPSPERRVKKSIMDVRKIFMVLILVSVIVGGAELIRSTRNVKEGLRGTTGSLKKLSSGSIITPTIYLYFSSSIGVLNQYLLHDRENTVIGGHMFMTPYRLMAHLGADIKVDVYQEWYRTPTVVNTGTYLRELHGDFGVAGLIVGPYVLGMTISFFWIRFRRKGSFVDLSITAFLFGIVGLSFIVIATRLGGYFFFPFVGVIVSIILNRKAKYDAQLFVQQKNDTDKT